MIVSIKVEVGAGYEPIKSDVQKNIDVLNELIDGGQVKLYRVQSIKDTISILKAIHEQLP